MTIKVLDPPSLSIPFYPPSPIKPLTKTDESTIEMRRLLVNIDRKLPNVAAAGPDLAALRILLNVQLDQAAVLDKALF